MMYVSLPFFTLHIMHRQKGGLWKRLLGSLNFRFRKAKGQTPWFHVSFSVRTSFSVVRSVQAVLTIGTVETNKPSFETNIHSRISREAAVL